MSLFSGGARLGSIAAEAMTIVLKWIGTFALTLMASTRPAVLAAAFF